MRRFYHSGYGVRGIELPSGALFFEVRDSENVGYIDQEAFFDREKNAAQQLKRYGIIVTPKNFPLLCKELNEVREFEQDANVFERVGHNGEHFVYADGQVISPRDASDANVIVSNPLRLCSAGTVEGWRERVAARLAGQPICEFALSIPFAAPLRRYTRRADNFGWLFWGPAGCGKTVLLNLAGSALDAPPVGRGDAYVMSFATTTAGLELEMGRRSDLPLLIDELNLFELSLTHSGRGRALSQLLMMLGKGEERRRFDGKLVHSYRMVFAFTANESLEEIIGGTTRKRVEEATAGRLISIGLGEQPYSIFTSPLAGIADPGDLIGELVLAQEQEHGTAMLAFLQRLMVLVAEDPAAFEQRLEYRLAEFRDRAGAVGAGSDVARIADSFGLVYAATRLAQYFGILPSDYDSLGSTLFCYDLSRSASTVEPDAAEAIRALFDDPQVVNLDKKGHLEISREKLEKYTAFTRTGKAGVRELLVTPAAMDRLLPNWYRVRRDNHEVARMLVRDRVHYTVKRRIRTTEKDRVYCFVRR